MTCVFVINGEERLPTEEEKRIMLDRFAESLGYIRQGKEGEEQEARAAMETGAADTPNKRLDGVVAEQE